MAYCRFGDDSDVYLYRSGEWECNTCRLADWYTVYLPSLRAALDHLRAHRAAGHRVPDHAIERVEREIRAGESLIGGRRFTPEEIGDGG